jgi:hypothetical protein
MAPCIRRSSGAPPPGCRAGRVGGASLRPPAQQWQWSGRAWTGTPLHAQDPDVVDGVSVPPTWQGVKRNARGVDRRWRPKEGSSHAAGVVTAKVVVDGYHGLPETLAVVTHAAKAAKALTSRTCGKLY